jgi:ribosomal protein S12 methylthiotransferase
VFLYSQEDGTTAFPLGDAVPQKEKERRKSLVMELQREIAEANNKQLMGTRQRVLVDRQEGGLFVGRTERDAPEIDNEVFIRTQHPLVIGDFVHVDIIDASEYDTVAVPAGDALSPQIREMEMGG